MRSFDFDPVDNPWEVTCNHNSMLQAQGLHAVLVKCPPGCASSGRVWGTGEAPPSRDQPDGMPGAMPAQALGPPHSHSHICTSPLLPDTFTYDSNICSCEWSCLVEVSLPGLLCLARHSAPAIPAWH